MNFQTLIRELDRVAARMRRDRLFCYLTGCWIVCALVAAVPVISHYGFGFAMVFPIGLLPSLGLTIARATFLFVSRRRVDHRDAAREIERRFPELDHRLLAAVEQISQAEQLAPLQHQLFSEVAAHRRSHSWSTIRSRGRLASTFLMQLGSFAIFLATAIVGTANGNRISEQRVIAERDALGNSAAVRYAIVVDPGSTQLERGTTLLVTARFPRTVPEDVTLTYTPTSKKPRHKKMTRSLDDPLFGGRIDRIKHSGSYHLTYADKSSERFEVTVFDYPQLERADFAVTYPSYTKLPETLVEDTRQVTIVEGSTVVVTCHANKPLASARLLAADEEPAITMEALNEKQTTFKIRLSPSTTKRYTLELIDNEGRHNRTPPDFTIEIIPNRRPELKLAFPAKDLRVSPIEEMNIEATAWDDFGLKQQGLIFTLAGKPPQTITLANAAAAREPHRLQHTLSLETSKAEPNQLVSYYLFADDIGPDGKMRRTYGDMYFAEVRHFEEIFRQGQQPPGGSKKKQSGGGKNAQKAEKLAALQKQILNATWNIYRRETNSTPTDAFLKDITAVGESQQAAIEQATKFAGSLTNAQSRAFAGAVIQHMQRAIESLNRAAADNQADLLTTAISAEQAAYQTLLKLRAREHKVVQGKQGGGGSSGGASPSQQQLNQLELTNRKNRYQTNQSQSQTKPQTADREQRQVANRLRELARRQGGLNDKIRELENELRLALSEQQKEELQRRLKRLREEQQQLLRDLDKLSNRMDRPQNQQKMAESRRELERTRSNVRKATEALRDGQTSKALNAGTRAERDLKRVRDDFRKQTAGRFADAMQQMRERSRELAESQKKIARQLQEIQQPGRRTLGQSLKRDDLQKTLADQKADLDGLLKQIQKTTTEAEQAEPSLSRQLYKTARKARDDRVREQMDATSELTKRGLLSEAGKSEQETRRGIEAIKKGIEKAAESVLGDQVESLKQVRRELADLNKSARNELAKNEPKSGQPAGKASNPQAGGKPGTTPKSSRSGSPGKTPGKQPGKKAGGGKSGAGGSGKSNKPARGSSKPSLLSSGGRSSGPGGPLTGSQFQQWSDGLRNVEEMIGDEKLRADVARVRDRARSMRADFKRHSKEPNWSLVRTEIVEPLAELQERIANEIARQESSDALVPIDRDPVPKQFSDLVRRYYERLGARK